MHNSLFPETLAVPVFSNWALLTAHFPKCWERRSSAFSSAMYFLLAFPLYCLPLLSRAYWALGDRIGLGGVLEFLKSSRSVVGQPPNKQLQRTVMDKSAKSPRSARRR